MLPIRLKGFGPIQLPSDWAAEPHLSSGFLLQERAVVLYDWGKTAGKARSSDYTQQHVLGVIPTQLIAAIMCNLIHCLRFFLSC